jgi:hypothetical protein
MLKELLKDHQLYHSEFQQDYYITGLSGGTLWGMYKQAIRELYKRTRGLREAYCDREKLVIEIEEQKDIAGNSKNEYKARYAAVEYKRKSMQMEEINRVIEDTEREFKRFYQQAIYLNGELGELTDERKKQLEEETQLFKVKEMIAIDYSTRRILSNITYERINALPKKLRNEILDDIKDGKIITWYENRDDFEFDYNGIKTDNCLLELSNCRLKEA